jgi:phosphate starvation-inducible PhoH-like protein
MSKSAKRYDKKNPPQTEQTTFRPKLQLVAKNKEQKQYLNTIAANELIFCSGSVGTGKTYCAAMSALIALESRRIDRIVLTRPIVPCGKRTLGYLKGNLMDKFAPFLEPYLETFIDALGASDVEGKLASGKIVAKPFEYMRGVTFRNNYVLLDEAQNTTVEELRMFIGRIGEGNKVIGIGDTDQKDIHEYSGLEHAIDRLQNVPNVGIYTFPSNAECVRNPLITDVMKVW